VQLVELLEQGLGLRDATLARPHPHRLPAEALGHLRDPVGERRAQCSEEILRVAVHLERAVEVERVVEIGVGPVVASGAQLGDGVAARPVERTGERRPPPSTDHLELEVRIGERHQHVTALAQLGRRHEDPVLPRQRGAHVVVDEGGEALGEHLERRGDLAAVAGRRG
jgi:hypothetical protein